MKLTNEIEDCSHLRRSISRKVQKTGGVSLSVTLPKSWVQSEGIESGDDVFLSINEQGDLVIQSPQAKTIASRSMKKEKIIDITGISDEFLTRNIVAAYLLGHNAILLRSEDPLDPKKIRMIENIIQSFIGLELIDSNYREITIHDLSSPESVDIIRFIKRMHKTVMHMLDDTIQGFAESSRERLQSVQLAEPNIDKLYYLLSRQLRSFLMDLNLESNFNFKLTTIIDYDRIVKRLEGLADHCYKVSQIGIHLLETSDEKLTLENDMYEDANYLTNMFRETMLAFFTKDITQSNDLINQSHAFRDKIWSRIIEFNIENSSLTVFNFLRLLERINNYIADIGEATINIFS